MDRENPRNKPGCRRRAGADVELLGRGAEVDMDRAEIDLLGGPLAPRRVDKEIVERGSVGGGVIGHQVATAAEGGEHGFRRQTREQAGDGGIEGVAAILQDFRRRIGGDRVAGRHDAPDHIVPLRVPG